MFQMSVNSMSSSILLTQVVDHQSKSSRTDTWCNEDEPEDDSTRPSLTTSYTETMEPPLTEFLEPRRTESLEPRRIETLEPQRSKVQGSKPIVPRNQYPCLPRIPSPTDTTKWTTTTSTPPLHFPTKTNTLEYEVSYDLDLCFFV